MKDNSKILLMWRDKTATKDFSTGISLHSHTLHSKEKLGFLPKVLKKVPGASSLFGYISEQHRISRGYELDYSNAYWTPPLSAHEAWCVERDQIEKLGLKALVSLTDHDSMEANALLQLVSEAQGSPFSVEWTVPYETAVFHVGIHNVPAHRSQEIMADFAEYTANPREERLAELLAAVEEIPDSLIILNHPLSDEGRIGNPIHEEHLNAFLRKFGRWMHALELNALQPWKDNRRVAEIARELGYPVIAGGDRHACEPNGNINLTNAETFSEFISEVRYDGVSNVLYMPQSREPLALRYMESLWDILRPYPERSDRQQWTERNFYIGRDGQHRPFAEVCGGTGPARIFSAFIHVFGFFMGPRMRPTWRWAFPKEGEEVAF